MEDHEPQMVGQGIRIKVKKIWPSKIELDYMSDADREKAGKGNVASHRL